MSTVDTSILAEKDSPKRSLYRKAGRSVTHV